MLGENVCDHELGSGCGRLGGFVSGRRSASGLRLVLDGSGGG